ncbi:MAG: hypothetical protein WC042_00605 [Candidatus Paceibacterota bacterium]|jgi:hypothetical protein|nr:hypothetical protein [Candidatus Paceibacterota bacterium]MDD3548460.1 hypothetical protein [Candidatus Paceibacterota bacterium]MDD4999239.1 hypothetical protein [Candidatus Paceibacterota bacterium]MDD5545503.1 hypothetical protein [Candidatus Paceibacterota bacterium]
MVNNTKNNKIFASGSLFPEPPEDLLAKIMKRIKEKQRKLALEKVLIVFSLGTVASTGGFIYALKAIRINFYESGFLHFLSLAFSDSEIVLLYWENFVLSLLESLPVMSLILFLVSLFVLMEIMKFLAKNIKFISKPPELTINV